MTPLLVGIDVGLTVTKAVLFDTSGTPLAVARRRVPQLIPQPKFVERDMTALWSATCQAVAEIAAQLPRSAQVAAIGATAHGDGLYLLDRDGRPLGPGILSLDSRAGDLVAEWGRTELFGKALQRSGQTPHASAPSALLAWIARHQPERFAAIGHVLACKDWLRFCLTGTIGTDLTEASTSFTDVQTQDYAPDILDAYGLAALRPALPAIDLPDQIVGQLTEQAALVCGLPAGVPVVAGLHDVTASALGVGGYGLGHATMVAGTYSINETVSDAPRCDRHWFCRNGLRKGEWNNMAISPASATNYDWFMDRLCAQERAGLGDGLHAKLAQELDAARDRRSGVMFHPYLFGSPYGPGPSAGFLGLRGWSDRGDMLRALMEGIAFNHRVHVDALRDRFTTGTLHLTGGISRNPSYAQLFADALGQALIVTDTEEPAAWGAALCAGAGVGLFDSPTADPRDLNTLRRHYQPDPERAPHLARRYRLHCDMADALAPVWARLEEEERP
ncbi:FGGY-family carbohydrate kinase [Roseibaca sp. Y0-43]|uniref:FGGY-family carbohydrate kinase n=1 Tax=Roseibaca sp. Y0-43 TaxID=2816854 RepID=UPI001D0C35E5|nr:FGGY-family carbohydrate kinase [Roseibaca sp. Y0-43]MCC1481112.1 carbohydrate kinase [Roseibaca sp. Y0-43]